MDRAEVSDSQNCGNILAGIGPWAIENGLVPARDPVTPVRIHMQNTASIAVAHVPTPGGRVEYEGDARIDGVPGTAAAIPIDFVDVAGSSCGALLPTGSIVDRVDGLEIDLHRQRHARRAAEGERSRQVGVRGARGRSKPTRI